MNSVPPLEAFADQIMHEEGWFPGSRSYRNRNPGNLRDSATKSAEDAEGYAVFLSFVAGYQALLADIEAKFSGRTRTGLGPESSIAQFFAIYAPLGDRNNPERYAADVCVRLAAALGRPITPATKLSEIWVPPRQG